MNKRHREVRTIFPWRKFRHRYIAHEASTKIRETVIIITHPMVNLQLHLIGKQTDKGHIARKKYMPVAHVVGIFSAGINQYHFHPERQTTGNVDHDISWAFGILKKNLIEIHLTNSNLNHATGRAWVALLSRVAYAATTKICAQCFWCRSHRSQLGHVNFALAVWHFYGSNTWEVPGITMSTRYIYFTQRIGIQGSVDAFLEPSAEELSKIEPM